MKSALLAVGGSGVRYHAEREPQDEEHLNLDVRRRAILGLSLSHTDAKSISMRTRARGRSGYCHPFIFLDISKKYEP